MGYCLFYDKRPQTLSPNEAPLIVSRFPFCQRRPGIHKRATNEPSRLAERVANFPDAFAQSRQRGHSVTYKLLITSGRSLARGDKLHGAAEEEEEDRMPCPSCCYGRYHGHFERNDDTDATSARHVSAPGHYLQASRFRMKNRQTTPV